MNKTDLNTVTITCPNQQCSNEFDYRIDDILRYRKTKCQKCRTEIEFDNGVVSRLKSAMQNLAKIRDGIMEKAKVKIRS